MSEKRVGFLNYAYLQTKDEIIKKLTYMHIPKQICDLLSTVKHSTAYIMQIFLMRFDRNLSKYLDRKDVQQNPTER